MNSIASQSLRLPSAGRCRFPLEPEKGQRGSASNRKHTTTHPSIVMPREAPDRLGDVSRSSSLPAVGNNVVVSRSVMRKPPRRGASGERLSEMKAMYRNAANNPGSLTPRNNRQRIVAKAVMDLSSGDLEMISDAEDDATINSTISSGSISLKSPGSTEQAPLRDSEDREKSSHSRRRRGASQSRKNSVKQRSNKPPSTRSVEDKEMDRSTRSERRSR